MRAAALRLCLRQPLPTWCVGIATPSSSRAVSLSRGLSSAATRPCGDCDCAIKTYNIEAASRWSAPVGVEQEVTAATGDVRAPQSPTAASQSSVTLPSSPALSSTPQLSGATASAPPSAARQRCDPYEQNGQPLSDAVVQQLLATLQPGWSHNDTTAPQKLRSTDDKGERCCIHFHSSPLHPPAPPPLLCCVHAGSTMRAAGG